MNSWTKRIQIKYSVSYSYLFLNLSYIQKKYLQTKRSSVYVIIANKQDKRWILFY